MSFVLNLVNLFSLNSFHTKNNLCGLVGVGLCRWFGGLAAFSRQGFSCFSMGFFEQSVGCRGAAAWGPPAGFLQRRETLGHWNHRKQPDAEKWTNSLWLQIDVKLTQNHVRHHVDQVCFRWFSSAERHILKTPSARTETRGNDILKLNPPPPAAFGSGWPDKANWTQ